jgi:hypothetical protein
VGICYLNRRETEPEEEEDITLQQNLYGCINDIISLRLEVESQRQTIILGG